MNWSVYASPDFNKFIKSKLLPLCSCVGNLRYCPRGFTLAVWIKISLLDRGTRFYFSSGGQTSGSHGVAIYTQRYIVKADFRTNGRGWVLRIAGVTVDVWFHIIITWDIIHARFYKDGCLADTASVAVWRSNENSKYNDIYIGRANSVKRYFAGGFLDDMYIIDTSVDDQDALDFYFGSF